MPVRLAQLAAMLQPSSDTDTRGHVAYTLGTRRHHVASPAGLMGSMCSDALPVWS